MRPSALAMSLKSARSWSVHTPSTEMFREEELNHTHRPAFVNRFLASLNSFVIFSLLEVRRYMPSLNRYHFLKS